MNKRKRGKEWSPLLIQSLGQSVSLWLTGWEPEIDGRIFASLGNRCTKITSSGSSCPGVVQKKMEPLLSCKGWKTGTGGHMALAQTLIVAPSTGAMIRLL